MAFLKSIEINQFRGIQQLAVSDLSNINLIVGDNNSGKTTFLEAIELLFAKAQLNSIKNVINQRTVLNPNSNSFYISFIKMFNMEQRKEQLEFDICADSNAGKLEFELRGRERTVSGDEALPLSGMSARQKVQYKRSSAYIPETVKIFEGSVITQTGKNIMKKARFLNSVGKKYIVGYVIVAVFSVVLLMVAVICNNYVSGQYDNAIGEMISINNLENSVEVLNGDINMAYLYLSEEGTENYEQDRKSAEQYLKMVKELQEKSFVREVTDAYCTVESFLGKSDFLTDALRRYFESDKQTGFEKLENSYNELQELYSYVTLRFQKAYSVKLNKLSQLENRLNALQQNILRLQIGMIVFTLICIGLYLTRVIMEISRSIATMQKGVESIQDNVLSAEPIQIESNDEFEEFAAAFNKMTGIIQKQMREIEENADIKERLAEMEIKNLKMFSELQRSHLDFLQSRVNPHFLFNTLNMISSLARIENADQCAELMETTAAFLRYNLDNISKTVPLEKEVENLKDYVAIQECRYGG